MTESAIENWTMRNPSYTVMTRVPGGKFDAVVEKVRDALKGEGFGVLTEIDFRATMKAKLDKDLPPYLILGACNPPLALKAVMAEPGLGALLPCNVVVAQEADAVFVGAIDPVAMFAVVGRAEVKSLAEEVAVKLKAALSQVM